MSIEKKIFAGSEALNKVFEFNSIFNDMSILTPGKIALVELPKGCEFFRKSQLLTTLFTGGIFETPHVLKAIPSTHTDVCGYLKGQRAAAIIQDRFSVAPMMTKKDYGVPHIGGREVDIHVIIRKEEEGYSMYLEKARGSIIGKDLLPFKDNPFYFK